MHGSSPATDGRGRSSSVSGGGLGSPLTLQPERDGCAFAQVHKALPVQVRQPSNGSLAGYFGTPPFVDTDRDFLAGVVLGAGERHLRDDGQRHLRRGDHQHRLLRRRVGDRQRRDLSGDLLAHLPEPRHGILWCPGGLGRERVQLVVGDPSGATNLTQVFCTTGSSPTCVGIGYKRSGGTNTGVILTTSSDFSSVNSDPVPNGVTDVTAVDCPSGTAATPLGRPRRDRSSSPVRWGRPHRIKTRGWPSLRRQPLSARSRQSNAYPRRPPAWWVNPPRSVAVRPHPASSGSTGTRRPLPPIRAGRPPSISRVRLPTCRRWARSPARAVRSAWRSPPATRRASDPTILSASIATTGPDNWSNESTFPTGMGSVTGLSCTSSTCVAIGTGVNGAPAVWTGDPTASPDDWAQSGAATRGFPPR